MRCRFDANSTSVPQIRSSRRLATPQARHLAEYLAAEAPLDALYTSPLNRARQTAAPVAEHFGLDVVVDDGVAEWDRHSNDYVPIEELKAADDPR
jgi:2,3-bisphosphoglycerate-dependent phosphoglycerate mutase